MFDLLCSYAFPMFMVLLMCIISFTYGAKKCETDMLRGFWQTNAEFNQEAAIHTFTMYIGDYKDGKYTAYLLMIENDDEGTVLVNEPVSFVLVEDLMTTFKSQPYREFVLRFDSIETDIIPQTLQFKFYPQTGKIMLMDSKKIYGAFFKNAVLSEMDRIKEERAKISSVQQSP